MSKNQFTTLFEHQTVWTEGPCFYVVALHRFRRAWLAGPYPTQAAAEAVLPRAVSWATDASGDPRAADYDYRVYQHSCGTVRSILGEMKVSTP